MTSNELRGYLNTFNTNIDKSISEYNEVSNSIGTISNNINSIKGSDGVMYNGILENTTNAQSQVTNIVSSLQSLKGSVNAKTSLEINRLALLEDEARRQKAKEEEGGND